MSVIVVTGAILKNGEFEPIPAEEASRAGGLINSVSASTTSHVSPVVKYEAHVGSITYAIQPVP